MIKKIPLKVVYALIALVIVYVLYILMPVLRGYAFAYASCKRPYIIQRDYSKEVVSDDTIFRDVWANGEEQTKYDVCIRSYMHRYGLK
ncbi:hypothetical protein [Brenneria uluponensis]|uniref:hypothetical protein n=1 Tax=Brenneria uluponensis TaxID=3057057 RepID=UPI0028F064E3|nr:hypothetical protein [Brenneria ulupoensis]